MRGFALALFLTLTAPAAVAADAAPGKSPQWFLDDIRRLTADGGRWIADNSAYKSEAEPFEAYGTQWVSGFDGDTMTGRLFGVKDGKELTFDFWEFRQYWHPGRKEAVVEQFGWGGAMGAGSLVQDGAGTVSDQTFHNADGSTTRTGHKSAFTDNDTYVTESFDIVGEEWKLRRAYIWTRQPTDNK